MTLKKYIKGWAAVIIFAPVVLIFSIFEGVETAIRGKWHGKHFWIIGKETGFNKRASEQATKEAIFDERPLKKDLVLLSLKDWQGDKFVI